MLNNGKPGRPRFKVDYQQAEILASRGLNYGQIAMALGCSRSCLDDCRDRDPKLQKVIDRGRAKGIAYVAGKLMKKIDSADLTAIIFYLKAQAGWRDSVRVESETTVKAEIPVGLGEMYAKLKGIETKAETEKEPQ